MFEWLWAWLRSFIPAEAAKSESPPPDSASIENRRIFQYWDGAKQRAIDPMVAWRGLHDDAEFSLQNHPGLIDAGDLDACAIGARAARRIFGVAEWSESTPGLTEGESLALIAAFLDYLGDVKKNTGSSPISSSVTESPPLPPENSTTKPGSDYGSTSTDPSSATPAAS